MSFAQSINRDLQVSFPISDVKNAIDTVCNASNARCQIEGKDDILNTYSLALIGGLAVIVPVTVQLKKISESETQILLSSTRATNNANQANEIVDNFIGLVSKALSGAPIEALKGNSGCMVALVSLVVFTASIVYSLVG
jgi:hypothetical protein